MQTTEYETKEIQHETDKGVSGILEFSQDKFMFALDSDIIITDGWSGEI